MYKRTHTHTRVELMSTSRQLGTSFSSPNTEACPLNNRQCKFGSITFTQRRIEAWSEQGGRGMHVCGALKSWQSHDSQLTSTVVWFGPGSTETWIPTSVAQGWQFCPCGACVKKKGIDNKTSAEIEKRPYMGQQAAVPFMNKLTSMQGSLGQISH